MTQEQKILPAVRPREVDGLDDCGFAALVFQESDYMDAKSCLVGERWWGVFCVYPCVFEVVKIPQMAHQGRAGKGFDPVFVDPRVEISGGTVPDVAVLEFEPVDKLRTLRGEYIVFSDAVGPQHHQSEQSCDMIITGCGKTAVQIILF